MLKAISGMANNPARMHWLARSGMTSAKFPVSTV
jgi:hypothetical protein